MHLRPKSQGGRHSSTWRMLLLSAALLLSSQVPLATAVVYPSSHKLYKFDYLSSNPNLQGINPPLTKRDNPIPLIITNNCQDTLWPGISTQHGDPPEVNGFELGPGQSRNMSVGPTWQGRVWGRTNCTTSGDTATCETGDCFGKLNCEYGGAVPVTLAEFNLAGGVTDQQTFYDISLVDGYNLPLGLVYHPADNTSYIPPNLVNAACIATAGYLSTDVIGVMYTNSTFPMPYEQHETNHRLTDWCPWDLQAFPPEKPGDGVYPYPDDEVQRPIFDPCKSACAAGNAPQDCCTREYNDPNVCEPGLYSRRAKAACPDAYSYAFDDQTSTFIIPSGGGWEIVFCPEGRSTNILATFGSELSEIAQGGNVTPDIVLKAMNVSYIEAPHDSSAAAAKRLTTATTVFAVVVAGAVLLVV
ncbi:thaumatin family protein [Biscogniauxia mediterranea]|nr:thaumatin family protein [Biscogniauxia mediterranea]